MLFHRLDFILFFLVVFAGYVVCRRRAQNLWLLAASYFFYAMWDWRFLSLILFSTLVDFCVGWAIAERVGRPKLWLALSVTVNLTLLGIFKYAGFFVASFVGLMNTIGISIDVALPSIILPVGISFYTFQSLSYTIDVYRGDTKAWYPAERGQGGIDRAWRSLPYFADFALYVAFFPQLVAGPIERSTRLLGQVVNKRLISGEAISRGCWLFMLGLVMKVAIADEIAGQVDAVYADLGAQTPLSLYLATLGFAIQIYCDFAGYSYMARGVAAILGFRLMVNFRQPFLASSFSDFWRRWHISLSTWIRDYLYIPLGGNRSSEGRSYFNLLLTMGLAGLWHGATWAFVAWGFLHGLFLAFERLALRDALTTPAQESGARVVRALYGVLVFHAVLLGWFLFRVGNLEQALTQLPSIFANVGGAWTYHSLTLPDLLPIVSFALLFVMYEIPCWSKDRELYPEDYSKKYRFLIYLILALMLLAAGGEKDAAFIYFQF